MKQMSNLQRMFVFYLTCMKQAIMLEFQYRVAGAHQLFHVTKVLVEYMHRTGQVEFCKLPALLGRVHHRRKEDAILRQDFIQQFRFTQFNDVVPALQGIHGFLSRDRPPA